MLKNLGVIHCNVCNFKIFGKKSLMCMLYVYIYVCIFVCKCVYTHIREREKVNVAKC